MLGTHRSRIKGNVSLQRGDGRPITQRQDLPSYRILEAGGVARFEIRQVDAWRPLIVAENRGERLGWHEEPAVRSPDGRQTEMLPSEARNSLLWVGLAALTLGVARRGQREQGLAWYLEIGRAHV